MNDLDCMAPHRVSLLRGTRSWKRKLVAPAGKLSILGERCLSRLALLQEKWDVKGCDTVSNAVHIPGIAAIASISSISALYLTGLLQLFKLPLPIYHGYNLSIAQW